jgi:hypothetical protein
VAVTRRQITGTRLAKARARAEDTLRNWMLGVPGVPPLYWRTKRVSEAHWTTPRPDCPHPGWWSATDEDSTEVEVTELVAAFVRALQPELAVETGTAFGQTAHAIGRALRRNGHGRLVTLEPKARRAVVARTRVTRLPVEVRVETSLDYEPDGPVDFAWLDSVIELRAAEFRHFFPHMHAGTVVGFHDTGPQHGLRPLLDELVDEGLMVALVLSTPRGVTFAQPLGLADRGRA